MPNRLPSDVLCFIGLKLDSTGDRIRFRAVSQSWRSALPFRQPPWLMLSPLNDEDEATQLRRFVSLGDRAILTIELPELHQARVVGSAGNWLITTHSDKTLRLTNPFSKLQLHLPSTFSPPPHLQQPPLLFKVVPSSFSQPENSDTRWVAILSHCVPHLAVASQSLPYVAVARRGDASWTPVSTCNGAVDVIFYNQMVYAVNDQGRLMICHIGRNPPRASFFAGGLSCGPCKLPKEVEPKYYLVERLGELLMVVRIMYSEYEDDARNSTRLFLVYKVDLENRKFDMLDSLGDHSLFLGFNTSVALLASDYFGLVRRNCIYFTHDYMDEHFDYMDEHFDDESGPDMGVFDLEDKTITSLFEGISTSFYSPPVWIIPA